MSTAVQPTLDLWSFEDRHQLGHIRLPWDTAGGKKAGDLIPAWVCCRCGMVELNRIFLEQSHGCCGEHPRFQPCATGGPYVMTAHWIPPDARSAAAGERSEG